MKILSSAAIRNIDAQTIQYDNITSDELMEKAATAFFTHFIQQHKNLKNNIILFCGTGNNGGDGLVVARLLYEAGYNVEAYLIKVGEAISNDCALNLDRANRVGLNVATITSHEHLPDLSHSSILIDAIFGTGLSREVSGLIKEVIKDINSANKAVISLDVPSGLFLDTHTDFAVEATETITFQIPKLALFLPDNNRFVGKVSIVDIGLNAYAIAEADTDKYFLTLENMSSHLKPLMQFAHKGTQGHALTIGGSLGKIGAVALSSKAALKSGCGLTTAYVPKCGTNVIQSYFPEAMVIEDIGQKNILFIDFDIYPDAIAIGMGMGKHDETKQALLQFLKNNTTPLVIDADALNMLSENIQWLTELQPNTILTPHPGELKRLIGTWENDFQKIELTRAFAKKFNLIIVIKGAQTVIVDSTNLFVNSSGTPALATAGSGDVLSGIIVGLLAQGYEPLVATQLGVYIHGMTANVTSSEINPRSFVASNIIDNISKVYYLMDLQKEK
jgi:hydroxyethylthiazole kinase-like uncharacterized protein yjeF